VVKVENLRNSIFRRFSSVGICGPSVAKHSCGFPVQESKNLTVALGATPSSVIISIKLMGGILFEALKVHRQNAESVGEMGNVE